MTSSVDWVQAGDPVVLDFVQTQPPVYSVDPSPTHLSLDSLADVEGAADGVVGDVLIKDLDGQWRPEVPPSGGGGGGGSGYHHDQLLASEIWTVPHGLGFNPSGIVVHDSIGDIVEPADVIYVNANVLRLLFTGRPMSGTADLS
jgi:hypothetical protein